MIWEMVPLDKLFIDCTGGNKKLKQSEFLGTGKLPIVDQGQKLIAGYTNDEEARCNVTLPCITFGDHTRAFKLIDFPFALGADGVKVLQPTKEVDARYAYFYLDQVKLAGKEGYQRNFKYLKQVSIPLPPLPVQKQIAAILEQADAAREKRRQANKLTEQFLQSAFLEMFGDPVTNPKGWEVSAIGKICKVETGGTPSRENPSFYGGTIPWVKTAEVNGGIILNTEECISSEGLSKSNCRIFPTGTILIAMYGQGLTRGRSAKLGINATTNQACAAILPNKRINEDYLWNYLTLSYRKIRNLGRGGNQPNLNLSIIKSFPILLPPRLEQQKFADLVEKVEKLRGKQRESEKGLENLFNALMQKAFKGELVK